LCGCHCQSSGEDDGASLQLVAEIVSDTDMSPFEIIHSGLVSALMSYVTAAPGGVDATQRDSRLRKFLRVFLSLPVRCDKRSPPLR